MKEMLSIKIALEDVLSLKDMLSLHYFSKGYNGMIYIRSNHKLINFNNLPKIVSFLLICKSSELEIVADGPDVEQTLIDIQKFFKPNKCKTNLLSPSF